MREVLDRVFDDNTRLRGYVVDETGALHKHMSIFVNGALWCGTVPGGLFRSENRGESWKIVESLWSVESRTRWGGAGSDQPAVHTINVDPRNPLWVSVTISAGGVWRTKDGGATWTPHTKGMVAGYVPSEQAEWPEHQDAHSVVQSPSSPEIFWCQHHVGIWRSDNDLESWTELHAQPSSFGFSVAVHPYIGNTEWFVPPHSDQKRAPIDGRVMENRTRVCFPVRLHQTEVR